MIDEEICQLGKMEPRRSLAGLEADIWAGVEARLAANRRSRVIFSCQAAVLAISIMISAAAGAHFASAPDSSSALNVFSTRADLAPAWRLMGR